MTAALNAPIELTDETFESFALGEGITVVDFWAPWCGPCRAFAPVFEQAAAKHPDVRFGKVNTDEQRQTAMALQIQAIPTLMIVRDRIPLYLEAGALPAAAFEELLTKAKAVDMDEVRRLHAEQSAQGDA
jgi:thioredoxin 1